MNNDSHMASEVIEAHKAIKEKIGTFIPEIGIILGSGMGMLADEVKDEIRISYKDIPGFPQPTVEGHAGSLVLGNLFGRNVVVMQGRFHFYEGHPVSKLALPVRVMHQLGVKILVVTNAAGGVNPDFKAGDFMLIRDHINFSFTNPLIGTNLDELGPRFPDTSKAYDPELIKLAEQAATEKGIEVKKGVYLFMTGPTYETPAEIRVAEKIGADAVGMSTFPETLAALHCGIKVLGISYISNLGAGLGNEKLSHKEVIETTNTIKGKFIHLVQAIIEKL